MALLFVGCSKDNSISPSEKVSIDKHHYHHHDTDQNSFSYNYFPVPFSVRYNLYNNYFEFTNRISRDSLQFGWIDTHLKMKKTKLLLVNER